VEGRGQRLSDDEWDKWFNRARQVITLGLGVTVILWAITTAGKDWIYILLGFGMIGLVPLDQWVVHLATRDRPRASLEPKAAKVPEE
jgi:hypothetical protein